MHSTRSVPRAKEEGSAFVISILVLFVLTVLGMAVMLTTTTEKDIAINYRWGDKRFSMRTRPLSTGRTSPRHTSWRTPTFPPFSLRRAWM